MNAWYSLAGSGCPCSQPGQWRQPSPESVTRTAAPVTTISHSAPSETSVSWKKRAGESSTRRRRAVVASKLRMLEKGLQNSRVPVGALERRWTGAEEERPVGGVQEHRQQVGPAQLAE